MPMLAIGQGWNCACIPRPTHCLLLPFFYIRKLLLAYAFSALFVYLYIPLGDTFFGYWNLCCHASFKEDEEDAARVLRAVHAKWPALKLFEQIGEAVPQFTIAVTFYSLNWHWLSPWDRGMGVGTMTLSAGSILMGVVKGGMIVSSEGGLKHFLIRGVLYD